ncbi:MAG TPA: Crp/Fnr family transcriptional regulator [Thiolapillus brandeum]|uniref:Crp/Fnr family transcriptional regulator n=1 Tax=Thiolapillus brandeum TaxID=1076588 RepID=A0A831JYB8_9GAMM|nr:Crp/Fnr family transcriptional regulator [Thiolapillus brandeum]
MMDAFTISSVLNRIPIFENLKPDLLYVLSRGSREIVVDKGERLFQKGDPAQGFYFVLDGRVKLAFISSRGTEKVVEIIHRHQSFGESVVLADSVWPYYSQALLDSRLLHISSTAFHEVVSSDRNAADLLLGSMARRLCSMFADMEAFCLLTSRERVVGYLLREIEQKRQLGDSDLSVDLPDTKANTASLLNLTPETFSRVIHALEREQAISVSRRMVTVLDLEKLQRGSGC